ncbi:MAG TPA: tautomerase family protein [Steroidobacteraceae bacterium]|jgi:phenylpyruvate tautomerase PptA (4-oxalocrotonate tautomerase family)|nr:tautomerase family protein [Steroidobacteraceae bacterium]
MPLVHIHLAQGSWPEQRRAIGDIIYEAMRVTINVPPDDRFQLFHQYAPGACSIDPSYLGIERGPGWLIIEITLNEGRTVEMKRALYKAIAAGLHERLGIRREDVFITLVETRKENWSFGNGVAQYAP